MWKDIGEWENGEEVDGGRTWRRRKNNGSKFYIKRAFSPDPADSVHHTASTATIANRLISFYSQTDYMSRDVVIWDRSRSLLIIWYLTSALNVGPEFFRHCRIGFRCHKLSTLRYGIFYGYRADE